MGCGVPREVCTGGPNFLRPGAEAGNLNLLAERLSSLHETLASIPALHTPGVLASASNSSPQGGTQRQGDPKFRVGLGYVAGIHKALLQVKQRMVLNGSLHTASHWSRGSQAATPTGTWATTGFSWACFLV